MTPILIRVNRISLPLTHPPRALLPGLHTLPDKHALRDLEIAHALGSGDDQLVAFQAKRPRLREHEASLLSAASVLNAIDKTKYEVVP